MQKAKTQRATRSTLRRISGIQFISYAARGLISPFIPLYLISVGFTGTQIGFLGSLSALIQLTSSPLLHTLADRSGRHRRLYYGLLTGNIGALLGMFASTN